MGLLYVHSLNTKLDLMKQLRFLLVLALFVSGIQFSQAQIDKGYLKMEITDISTDNEQLQGMSGMFTGSFTEVYFTPEKSYTLVNMMGGMSVTQVLVDKKSNANQMLISAMGQKMLIEMNQEELKEMQAGAENAEIEYKHFRDETKEILGFPCHKVNISGAGTQGADMVMWVTEEISTDAHVTNGVQMDELGGFPLEYIISFAGQMELTMKATQFEKTFDSSVFNLDTEGYKKMTMDEFMDTMKSMGGGM
jgi:hypothetical protein